MVGLYLPRSFMIFQVIIYPFPQIEQVCAIVVIPSEVAVTSRFRSTTRRSLTTLGF
jgi:hypothetical protein